MGGGTELHSGLTWYLVRSVLQTPVSSIMATRNGMMARVGMMVPAMVVGCCRNAGVDVVRWCWLLLWEEQERGARR